jgi:aerobic-type carbon monoxide dehydrogenase small subunit (CoxS/CutS family)
MAFASGRRRVALAVLEKLGPVMEQEITFTLNGEHRTIATDPARPLLEVLREDLGLTGVKHGCGEGRCGACTVLVGGRPVVSCTTAVADARRQSITTIEGLERNGNLHRVQEAFLAEDAFQCGYCTPGMILAVAALLDERPIPTEPQIRSRLETHLCRCCGYSNILKAIRRALNSAARD